MGPWIKKPLLLWSKDGAHSAGGAKNNMLGGALRYTRACSRFCWRRLCHKAGFQGLLMLLLRAVGWSAHSAPRLILHTAVHIQDLYHATSEYNIYMKGCRTHINVTYQVEKFSFTASVYILYRCVHGGTTAQYSGGLSRGRAEWFHKN